MPKLKIYGWEDSKGFIFKCPGCKEDHIIYISGAKVPNWSFNGDVDKPTFSPSLLIRTGHYIPGHNGKECWCTYNQKHPEDKSWSPDCAICHSFIREGKIQFLNDCTHELAGQTVEIPDY